jgi:pyruvate dehydrogenase E2 component (dihydrolipoamide acetyltransferase)
MAREVGIPLEELAGTGPGGIICLKDVEVAAASGQKPGPRASTLAGRAARNHSIALEGIEGTGVRGRIMQKDVETAAALELTPGLGKRIPMSSMRQAIARRMTQSAFSAPHIYFFTDIVMDDLLAFRTELLPEIEKRAGVRLSINDLLIKAVALNILDFPLLNAVAGEAEILIQPDVNVGLAVALSDGLIVPAVPMVDRAGLAEIARLRKDLVERARRGKLKQEEMERGTFTISSLAQSEVTQFTAILNPPQSGILSVGKLREELYLHHGEVRSRRITSFGLSADHRIIDGQMAADFLKRLKARLERPHLSFAHI